MTLAFPSRVVVDMDRFAGVGREESLLGFLLACLCLATCQLPLAGWPVGRLALPGCPPPPHSLTALSTEAESTEVGDISAT